MKTTIFKLAVALCTIYPLITISQVREEVNIERQERFQERKREIESKKIAFITEKISLTPEEAQVFWPIYNEFQKKKEDISKENRMMRRSAPRNYDELNENELNELADAEIDRMIKMTDVRKEYHEKFKTILPIKKLVMFYDAEKEFKKVLLDDLRNERKERRRYKND